MRKFLKFKDGNEVELSPLSYAEFMALDLWCGSSDSAFEDWKRKNDYVEAKDFRDEVLQEAELIVSPEAPIWDSKFMFNVDDPPRWDTYYYQTQRQTTKLVTGCLVLKEGS